MAYDFFGLGTSQTSDNVLQIEGSTVELPDASYIRDAALVRDGMDLVLDGPHGTITVEGYFAAPEAPNLVSEDGLTLTPELVNSFAKSPAQYAQQGSLNDVSPVGAVDEASGDATITRTDGTVEPITLGTPVYQGDVIETSIDGAVNVSFIDETSFAVSEEARLAIDEYVFDPATEAGSQNFSVLKGVFVFTSGLIGRDDPDDVGIDTPSGSIGIRGTIIAGNADTGEITVVEGAIVVRDFNGNEMTLANQFETAKLDTAGNGIENLGQLPAQEVSQRFVNVSNVSPTLFSSINDAMAEQQAPEAPQQPNQQPDAPEANDAPRENFDADGTVDGNNDSEVDGTIEEGAAPAPVDGAEQSNDAPNNAPQNNQSNMQPNMMGTDPMGMNNAGMGDGMPGMNSGAMGMNAGTTAAMDAMGQMSMNMNDMMGNDAQPNGPDGPGPDGPNPLQDPNTIVPNSGSGAPDIFNIGFAQDNGIPMFNAGQKFGEGQVSLAPAEFFQISSNQSFDYFFDLEFASPGNPGAITGFELTAATVGNLNTIVGGGNWTFDNSNGHLTINTVTIGADQTFDIQIQAVGQGGKTSVGGFIDYQLDLFAEDYTGLGSVLAAEDAVAEVYTDTVGNNDILTVGSGNLASNKDIFAGDGNDTITIQQGTNNYINLGNGDNQVTVIGGSVDNTIVGGNSHDSFNLDNVDNQAFGMDGDDVFILDAANAQGQLTSATNALLDGGHSSFKAGDALNAAGINYQYAQGDTGGFGDTLVLENNGAIDFSAIDDDYIKGIERIDLRAGGSGNTQVDLSYNDVIQMTDFKNTIIFRFDAGDTLNFDASFAGFNQIGNDITTVDDNYDGSGNAQSFDVYSDGNVTLLIEQNAGGANAGTVTGL